MTIALNIDRPAGDAHYRNCASDELNPDLSFQEKQTLVASFFEQHETSFCMALKLRAVVTYCPARQSNIRHQYSGGALRALFAACKDCKQFHRDKGSTSEGLTGRYLTLTAEGLEQAKARSEELRTLLGKRTAKKLALISNCKPGPEPCSREVTQLQRDMRAKLLTLKGDRLRFAKLELIPISIKTGYHTHAIREFVRGVYRGNNEKIARELKRYFGGLYT
jgi:hypothetical protein